MLISAPFLTAAAQEDDPTQQSVTTLGERSGKGAFPVSGEFSWHGGIHLDAPGAPDNPEPVRAIADGEVVFARSSTPIPQHIDDPAVIAADPLLYYKGWTSNGVVILKHSTEIGDGVNVVFYSIYQHLHTLATRRVNGHDVELARGDHVYRKDAIGSAGAIYGQPNRIHFEIVADAENVAQLMGRNSGPLVADQGRTTSLWGDMHIVLPSGTPLYAVDPSKATISYIVRPHNPAANAPNDNLDTLTQQFSTTLAKLRKLNPDKTGSDADWFDRLTGAYQANLQQPLPNDAARTIKVPAVYGADTAPQGVTALQWTAWQVPVQARTSAPSIISISEARGTITLTTRSIRGMVLGSAPAEDAYGLYTRAASASPGCASAGYEMLRFGRVLGPDAPADGDLYRGHLSHIRQIHSPVDHTAVYVDLNVPGVCIYSDADFPHWLGWAFIDDDIDGNSRCDSDTLLDMLDPPPATATSPASAENGTDTQTPTQQQDQDQRRRDRIARAYARSFDATAREELSYCVVKMPTEWASSDFDPRWGWVKGDNPLDLPANVLLYTCLSPDAYTQFKQHHSALAFWEAAQEQGLALDKVHYHFHPTRFIQTFRKCMWLSADELARIYPDNQYNHHETPDPHALRERYRKQVNQATRKYSVNTPMRMSHFFGQGAVESFSLARMVEASAIHFQTSLQPETNGYYNDPHDTYFNYLENRLGNISPGDGIKFRGRGLKQLTGLDNYAKYWVYRNWLNPATFDAFWWQGHHRRVPRIDDPQRLSTNAYNCIDAGAWFWTAGKANTVNKTIGENGISPDVVSDVSIAINGTNPVTGQPNGLPERTQQTQRIGKILMDGL